MNKRVIRILSALLCSLMLFSGFAIYTSAAAFTYKKGANDVSSAYKNSRFYKNLTKISTVNMSREEWLEHRKNSIGGSESASILGMNPYSSAYTVWADKLGKLPEIDDNEAMRQGRDLEAYVAQRFTEQTGKKVRRENNILWNPDYPFAHANVDRLVVGEDAGLECKTCSALRMKEFKNGAFPDT